MFLAYKGIVQSKKNGGIVTSGLLLNLDAGNPASYPGTGATWTDLSGNSNNATLYNSPTYSSSNGGTLYFNNASSQYGVVVNNGTLNSWTAQTIGVWCTLSTISGNYIRLIEKGSNTEWAMVINFPATPNKISIQMGGTGNNIITSTMTINNSGYYYFALTISSTYYCTFYVNGVVNGQAQAVAPAAKTGIVNIGQYGGGGYYWNGNIPQVQVYNRSLNSTEILQNYNASKSRYGL